MDETYIKVKGEWKSLYRAVDKYGKTIDFLLTAQRDEDAAKRFLTKAIRRAWRGSRDDHDRWQCRQRSDHQKLQRGAWYGHRDPSGKIFNSILKFFQVDSTGMFRMTSSARYFKKGVGSSRPNWRWIMCFLECPKANTSCNACVKRFSFS